MRKVIAKAGLFFIILTWISGWFPGTAIKAAYTGTEGGSVTVKEAAAGDLLCGYKLIDASYDAAKKAVAYTWADGIEALIAEANGGEHLSVNEFIDLTQSEKLAILAKLRAQLEKTPELSSKKVDDSGTVEWQDVPIGGYMIIPVNTTQVYQIMFGAVQPAIDTEKNDYYTMSLEFVTKRVPIKIVKTVNTVTTGQTHTVEYNVTVDIPTYAPDAVDKYFGIGDKSVSGIDIDDDSIHVFGYASREDADEEINATEFGTLTQCIIDGLYTRCEKLKGQSDVQDFAMEFDYNKIPAGISVIKIVYQARTNESAMVGGGGNVNVAMMEYSINPFVMSAAGEYHEFADDEQEIYTFQLQIVKTAADDKTVRLSGAAFDLYRRAEEDETEPVLTGEDIPQLGDGSYVLVTHMEPTDQEGITSAKGLNLGTYYLVETKAPNGYRLPDKAVEIKLTEEDGLNTETGILTAVIENVKEDPPVVETPKEEPKDPPKADPPKADPPKVEAPKVEAPKTADIGQMIFGVIGVLLTVGIVFLVIFGRKKESKS